MFFGALEHNMRICHCLLRGYLCRLSVYIKYMQTEIMHGGSKIQVRVQVTTIEINEQH